MSRSYLRISAALFATALPFLDGCDRKDPYHTPRKQDQYLREGEEVTGCYPEKTRSGRPVYKKWILRKDGTMEPLPQKPKP